jgi:hypothetical protein
MVTEFVVIILLCVPGLLSGLIHLAIPIEILYALILS